MALPFSHTLTFADICAGIGGFRQGLALHGMNCVFSADIDRECEKTYFENFGEFFNQYDVFDIEPEQFPNVDILCAGFPCQPYSIAGKRQGLADSRSDVFFQIARIAQLSQPRVLFLENVPNLIHSHSGKIYAAMEAELRAIGYTPYSTILDSADFGVPQRRKRLYMVAFRNDLGINSFQFTPKTSHPIPVRSILIHGDDSIPISDKWRTYIDLYSGKIGIDQVGFAIPKTRRQLERSDAGVDFDDCIFQMRSSGIRALSIDKPLPTLAVSISGGGAMIPVYSKERRHLSVREMARIMGFEDSFVLPVSRTNAIKQLANAVCPPVIKSIGSDIIGALSTFGVIEQTAVREQV